MSARILCSVLILSILFLSTGCQAGPASSISLTTETPLPSPTAEGPAAPTRHATISVPQGRPDAIDGTMTQGEWDSAATETFSDGSQLSLMFHEGFLYLGIRATSPELIVTNVFIERGDGIAILHSSAALGTAMYREGVDSWEQTEAFVWRCRRTDDSEVAQAERDAFLEEERWVAANALMGAPNEMEYQIEVTDESLRLAVVFVRESSPNVKLPWPVTLDDDCIMPTPGEMPEQLHFSLAKWATINVSPPEAK